MYTNLRDKKIFISTLGCKVNSYESDAMIESLKTYGCTTVESEAEADICIINTCSVTNMADRKSRQVIHKARKANSDTIICATGCYVQAAKESIVKDGYVDIIIGNNRKKDVARIISEYITNQNVTDNFIDINDKEDPPEYEATQISSTTEHTRAYVKIQDGCNNFCTYCIIPYARGRIRSNSLPSIVDEITKLANNGIKEVVLTGINLSSYSYIENDTTYTLKDVIVSVSKIPGILRIRLGSLEPRIITEDFLETISSIPQVCPHFHLSLQSACNDTLKRMNRHYTIEEYAEKCELIRKYYDRPALTTDVIVGFPGETEEEFQNTYDNLSKINLYEMHIFKYSKRKGTIACDMKDQVDEKIKGFRSEKLIEMREKHQKSFEATFNGELVNVLVEEIVTIDGEDYFRGHTERYLLIDVKCSDYLSSTNTSRDKNDFINTIIKVKK